MLKVFQLQGGKAAAETILDMRATGDFSKASCKEYARRWNAAFGYDFSNVSHPSCRLSQWASAGANDVNPLRA